MSERLEALKILEDLNPENIVAHLEQRLYGYKPVQNIPLVIRALGRLGGPSKAPILLEILQQPTANIESKRTVLEVFNEIRPVQIKDQLVELLQAVDVDLQGDLSITLAELQAEECIPQLINLLKENPDEAGLKIIHALEIFGETAAKFVPELETLYENTSFDLQQALTQALQNITGSNTQTTFFSTINEETIATGRELDIRRLEVGFMHNRIVNLYGSPGIGKTTLSKLFATQRITSGRAIVWVNFCDSASNTKNALMGKLSSVLKLRKNSAISTITEYLDSNNIIVCIDHLEDLVSQANWKTSDMGQFIISLIENTQKALFLLISTYPLDVNLGLHVALQLEEFSLETTSGLLKMYGLENFLRKPQLLQSMYNTYIGGNPSILQLFITWIKLKDLKGKFIKLYEQKKDPLNSFFKWKELVEFVSDRFLAKLSDDALAVLQIISLFRIPFNTKDPALGALLHEEGIEDWENAIEELQKGYTICIKNNTLYYGEISPPVRWFLLSRMDIQHGKRIHKKLSEYFLRSSVFFEAVYHQEQAGNISQAAQLAISQIDNIVSKGELSPLLQWLKAISTEKLDVIEKIMIDSNIACLLRLQGEYKQAEVKYNWILQAYKKNNDRIGIIRVKGELSELFLEQGFVLEAYTQLLQAKQLFSTSNIQSVDLMARIESNIIYANLLLGKEVSILEINRWRNITEGLSTITQIHIRMTVLRVSIVDNDKDEAIKHITELYQLSNSSGSKQFCGRQSLPIYRHRQDYERFQNSGYRPPDVA